MDRFAIRLELRYLSEQEETSMLRRRLERGSAEPTVNQVVDAHDLVAMRESVEQVTVHDDVLHYVVSLANATRQHPQVAVGASPRAELDLVQHRPCARASARSRLRDTRGREVACRSHHGTPDQPEARDVGAPRARRRRRRGTAAAVAGSAGRSVIDDRRTEAELRWRASPLTRAVATCAGVVAGRGADRIAVAAHRVRGAAAGRVVFDRLAADGAEGLSCTQSPACSAVSKGSRRS